jgi:hypothetical protein
VLSGACYLTLSPPFRTQMAWARRSDADEGLRWLREITAGASRADAGARVAHALTWFAHPFAEDGKLTHSIDRRNRCVDGTRR